MIPKFKVEIIQDCNLKMLEMPDNEIIETKDGLLSNREYFDLRLLTWGEFKEAYSLETSIIDYADKNSETYDEFEEILDNAYNNDFSTYTEKDLWPLQGLDIGIASLTIALAAFGCSPVSSCRGHFGKIEEPHPYVGAWSYKERASVLVKLAKNLNVGITNYKIESYGGLLIYSDSITPLLEFGKNLHEKYGRCLHKGKKKQRHVPDTLKEYQNRS